MITTPALLRRLLHAGRPVVLAGAHDALSARLVEETGYDGVWASGFEISASRGVPDASLLTMSEMLETSRQMTTAVSIPLIADCDGGFGNAINAIHMTRAYEQAGVAAVCIEDTAFPKRCSLYADHGHELTSLEEQALKIQAVCDERREMVVIARTEALVAKSGLAEAMTRAHAYADAGADAILVHSNRASADEVIAFAERWQREVPLVAVPTTYGETRVEELYAAGFGVVIFANHGLRASIAAMRATLRQLRFSGCAASVADRIVSLRDVFDLVRLPELEAAEQRYLPGGTGVPRSR